jgi:hypothetical protein
MEKASLEQRDRECHHYGPEGFLWVRVLIAWKFLQPSSKRFSKKSESRLTAGWGDVYVTDVASKTAMINRLE